jgi:excisionase family DNA binding protein
MTERKRVQPKRSRIAAHEHRLALVEGGDRQIPKILLSYAEAAWSLGIGKSKLYQMVSEGKLPVVKMDGSSGLRPRDLEAYVDANVVWRNGTGPDAEHTAAT